MAHKTFCDRCGKEIKPRRLFRPNNRQYDVALKYELERWGFGMKKWELCFDCAKALRDFMNDPDERITARDEESEEEEENDDNNWDPYVVATR